MFGKILKFARPAGSQPVPAACPKPDRVTADELIEMEYADTVEDTLPDKLDDALPTVKKVSVSAATREFLDVMMAEVWELFTRAGHPVPQELKLTTVLKRYRQLRPDMRWPHQDKAMLAKQLVACGCKSHRRTTKTGKVGVIEFPSYPAAGLPGTAKPRRK